MCGLQVQRIHGARKEKKKKNLDSLFQLPSALYLFTGGKGRLREDITCLKPHRELVPTIILLQQNSPGGRVVDTGKQKTEE